MEQSLFISSRRSDCNLGDIIFLDRANSTPPDNTNQDERSNKSSSTRLLLASTVEYLFHQEIIEWTTMYILATLGFRI